MRTFTRLVAALALVPGALAAQQKTPAHGTAPITAEDVKSRIGYLASDELRGRDTPSPGLDAAADYIAGEMARFKLLPAGEGGTYFQRYPFQKASLDRSAVAFRFAGVEGKYALDFFLVPGPVDSLAAEAVYAGIAKPGLSAPPEAKGKVLVVALNGSMGDQAAMQAWQQNIEAALMAGMSGGAAAVVAVLDPSFPAPMMGMLSNMTAAQQSPVPLVGVTHAAIAPAFTAAGKDLAQLRTSDPASPIALASPVMVRSATGRKALLAPNVVAVLPGSDPALKNEYVVYSAHMDHVGVGASDATGDSIFNGADDDASGVTALLEAAQAFASLPTAPKRSIVFLFVSGEEKGLLGSAHFVAHPTLPLDKVVANINIDMIGRNNPDTVVAIGQDYTDLGSTVQKVALENKAAVKLVVAPDLWPEENLFFRSDHFSFAAKGVPAIFFTTGLHADYHKQSDEPETIDNDKLARITKLVYELGNTVANSPARPQWTDAGKKALKLK